MKLKLSRSSIVILAVAFALAGYGLVSSSHDDSNAEVAAVVRKPGAAPTSHQESAAKPNIVRTSQSQDSVPNDNSLSARIDLLQGRTNQAQQIHDVFAVNVPPPPPPAPLPVQKPTAPPFPYTFLGAMQDGNIRTLYLSLADRVVIARSGQDIDHLYHVDSIAGEALTVTYLPLHQQQIVALGRSR